MRRLHVRQLADEIKAPANADILAVEIGVVIMVYDASEPHVARNFVGIADDEPVPVNSRYIGAYRPNAYGLPRAVFEVFEADVPADLPEEAHEDYRAMLAAGFTLTEPRGDRDRPETPTAPCWRAPDCDDPVDPMLYAAVARLQEHGYGPIVGA